MKYQSDFSKFSSTFTLLSFSIVCQAWLTAAWNQELNIVTKDISSQNMGTRNTHNVIVGFGVTPLFQCSPTSGLAQMRDPRRRRTP